MKKLMQSKFFSYILIAGFSLGNIQSTFAFWDEFKEACSWISTYKFWQAVHNKRKYGHFKTNDQLNWYNEFFVDQMSDWVAKNIPAGCQENIFNIAQHYQDQGKGYKLIAKSAQRGMHMGIVEGGEVAQWYLYLLTNLSKSVHAPSLLELIKMQSRYNSERTYKERVYIAMKNVGEQLYQNGLRYSQAKVNLDKVLNNIVADIRSKLSKSESLIHNAQFAAEARSITGRTQQKAYDELSRALSTIGFKKSVGFGDYLRQDDPYDRQFTHEESRSILNTLIDLQCNHGVRKEHIIAIIKTLASQYDNAHDLLEKIDNWLGDKEKFFNRLKQEALTAIKNDQNKINAIILEHTKAEQRKSQQEQSPIKFALGKSFKYAYGPKFDETKFAQVMKEAGYNDAKVAECLKNGLDKDTLKMLKKKADKGYYNTLEKGFVAQQVCEDISKKNIEINSNLLQALTSTPFFFGKKGPKSSLFVDMSMRTGRLIRLLTYDLGYDVKKTENVLKSGITKDLRTQLVRVANKEDVQFIEQIYKLQKESATSGDGSTVVTPDDKKSNDSKKKLIGLDTIKDKAQKAASLAKDNPGKSGAALTTALALGATAYAMNRGSAAAAAQKSEDALNKFVQSAYLADDEDIAKWLHNMKLVSDETKSELKHALAQGVSLDAIIQAAKEEIKFNEDIQKKAGILGQLTAGISGFKPQRKPHNMAFVAPIQQPTQPMQQPTIEQPVITPKAPVEQPDHAISIDPWDKMDAFTKAFAGLIDPQNNGHVSTK